MITEKVMAVAFSAVVLFVSPVFLIYTVLMYGTRVPVHTIHATHATNMERGFPNLSTNAIHYTEKLVCSRWGLNPESPVHKAGAFTNYATRALFFSLNSNERGIQDPWCCMGRCFVFRICLPDLHGSRQINATSR